MQWRTMLASIDPVLVRAFGGRIHERMFVKQFDAPLHAIGFPDPVMSLWRSSFPFRRFYVQASRSSPPCARRWRSASPRHTPLWGRGALSRS
jgi:hypothetical protein